MASNRELVTTVTKATVKKDGSKLKISATGMPSNPGWKDPALEPVVYVTPPADGIWDVNFTADSSSSFPGDVLFDPLEFSYDWENPPAELKGVRVKGSSNEVVAKL